MSTAKTLKSLIHSSAAAIVLFGFAGFPHHASADWLPQSAGTYSYNDTANWSSATINGLFSDSPAITGAQTITFNANTTLHDNTLRFTYTSANNLTFASDSATVRELLFPTGVRFMGITSNGQGDGTSMRTVTFEDTLTLNLGTVSDTRVFRMGQNTNLVVNAKITSGNSLGRLNVQTTAGSENPGSITFANDANDFISIVMVSLANNFRVTSVADAGQPSALGAGSLMVFGNGSNSVFEYIGNTASTNRTIRLENITGTSVDIINNGASGSTLTWSGDIIRPETAIYPPFHTLGASTLRFGGARDIVVSGAIDQQHTNALSLVKIGANTLTLSGNSNHTGTTTVSTGTLLIDGTITGTGAVSVAVGAAIGGGGSVAGNLSLADGANFVFELGNTLSVSGSVTLHTNFGVANILGLDSSTPNAVYTLIDVTATDFGLLGIQNWGSSEQFDLGGGKFAYFQQGSLQLVVIPEPRTGVLAGLVLLLGLMRRCVNRAPSRQLKIRG